MCARLGQIRWQRIIRFSILGSSGSAVSAAPGLMVSGGSTAAKGHPAAPLGPADTRGRIGGFWEFRLSDFWEVRLSDFWEVAAWTSEKSVFDFWEVVFLTSEKSGFRFWEVWFLWKSLDEIEILATSEKLRFAFSSVPFWSWIWPSQKFGFGFWEVCSPHFSEVWLWFLRSLGFWEVWASEKFWFFFASRPAAANRWTDLQICKLDRTMQRHGGLDFTTALGGARARYWVLQVLRESPWATSSNVGNIANSHCARARYVFFPDVKIRGPNFSEVCGVRPPYAGAQRISPTID